MAKQFYTIPSNDEIKEINDNKHFTDNVKKGMLNLHKTDSFIKEVVMRAISAIESYDLPEKYSVNYTIRKIEIIAPHMLEDDKEYIYDTLKGFVFDVGLMSTIDSSQLSELLNLDIKEAFLVQITTDDLCIRYVEAYDNSGEQHIASDAIAI